MRRAVIISAICGLLGVLAPSAGAVALPPSPPRIAVVIARLDGIQVVFAGALDDGGSPIVAYTADCTSSNGGIAVSVSGIGVASFDGYRTLTPVGATRGKRYTCTIAAANSSGSSADSAPSSAVVVGRPSAPVAYGELTVASTSVIVNVAHAGDGGAGPPGFAIYCTSSDGGVARSVRTPTAPITVAGLSNGHTYACAIHATNALGLGMPAALPTFVAGRPTAPLITGIVPIDQGLIPLVSAPDSDGGAPITGYQATCTSSDGGATAVVAVASLPVNATGLTNGKHYTCAVQARNASGYGTVATTGAGIPGRPEAPFVGLPGAYSGHVMVPFVPALNDGGSPITGYEATCTSDDGGAPGSQAGPSSSLTVSGLTDGKTYRCSVVASNAGGPGVPSPLGGSVIVGRPTRPFFVDQVPGVGQISVEFQVPGLDGGSPIIDYSARCVSFDGGAAGTVTGTASPLVVTGLDNGHEYTCMVRAETAIGSSVDAVGNGSIRPGRPSAPTNPAAVGADHRATIAFAAPAQSGGATITGYVATCRSNNGGVTRTASAVGAPVVVMGLTNGAAYDCSVGARTVDGGGGLAFTQVWVGAVPGLPRVIRTTPGARRITLTFAAPVITGGFTVTGYKVTCSSSNGGVSGVVTGTASPLTATNLTARKRYTCRIAARNELGYGNAANAPAVVPT